jgi:hypothetical protein
VAIVRFPVVATQKYTEVFDATTANYGGSTVSWTVPAGVTKIKVTTIGAGGSGGDFEWADDYGIRKVSTGNIDSTSNSSNSSGGTNGQNTTFTYGTGGGAVVYTGAGGLKGPAMIWKTKEVRSVDDTSLSVSTSSGGGTTFGSNSGPAGTWTPGKGYFGWIGYSFISVTWTATTRGGGEITNYRNFIPSPGCDAIPVVHSLEVTPGTVCSIYIGENEGNNNGESGGVVIEYVK